MHKYGLNNLETVILSPPKGISHQQALHRKKLGHMATHNPIPFSSKLRSIVNLPVREKIHRNKQRFEIKASIKIYSELLHFTTLE